MLDNPDVLKVYEILDKNSNPTIIMEYFNGKSLKVQELTSMTSNFKINVKKIEILNKIKIK